MWIGTEDWCGKLREQERKAYLESDREGNQREGERPRAKSRICVHSQILISYHLFLFKLISIEFLLKTRISKFKQLTISLLIFCHSCHLLFILLHICLVSYLEKCAFLSCSFVCVTNRAMAFCAAFFLFGCMTGCFISILQIG